MTLHRTTKTTCAALLIDLSRAFNTVNHSILKQRLRNIPLSEKAASWFKNYLTDWTQCVTFDGVLSKLLHVALGVLQGSTLGPLLFTIYINYFGLSVANAKFHFHADDMVIYSCGDIPIQTLEYLQYRSHSSFMLCKFFILTT